MLKRFFISTKVFTPLKTIKGLLGKQCYSAFSMLSGSIYIYFVSLTENIDQNVFQQKISTIFSDMNMQILEFDNSFEYTEKFIYIDPTISIEALLDIIFIGGWSIERGENDLYIKVTSSRDEDCFNLACFLKYLGITFSSSLGQFPVVEIQNLPPSFNSESFNQMNKLHLKVLTSFSKFLDDGETCKGFVLAKNIQSSNDLIRLLNKASISQYQIRAFLKFSSQSSSPSNSTKFTSTKFQGQNNIFTPPIANDQNQTFSTNHQQMQAKPSKPQNKVKEVKIYPASFTKTVHIRQPSNVEIDHFRTTAEKYGKIDRLSVIETKPESKVFEVVYNKTGSCDTILKSNEFKGCSKKADIHLSHVAISPAIQYFPEDEDQPSNLDLFDIKANTVIIALEKDDNLIQFAEKMKNFGVYNRIVYQTFEDRKEVAVTFSSSGSISTLLKCKEFLNSAAMADELYKYRSQQKQNYQQQQQPQQQPFIQQQQMFNFQQQQQQQPPNSFNFHPQQPNLNGQPPNFNFAIQQPQQQPAPFNLHQQPAPFNPQQQPPFNFQQPPPFNPQFFPNQPPFQQFPNNGVNPNFFMGNPPIAPQQQPPQQQQQQQFGQKLILSSSQNSYASDTY